MLRESERWVFLSIFVVFVLAAGYAEYTLLQARFSLINAIWVVAVGGVLVGSGKIFLKVISKMFLELGLTPSRLQEFSSERCRILAAAQNSNEDEYETRLRLITNTLKFSEKWLRGWVPGSHFELCIFVDLEMPLLFAYFDSNHHSVSRSAKDRERNPKFYIDEDYEVTKLLRRPESKPRVVGDTAKTNYVFLSKSQRDQLKSTVLLCPGGAAPCALVVTSNKKNAFQEKQTEVMSFIKYIGETVYYDLIEDDFLNRVRELRPHLFQRSY